MPSLIYINTNICCTRTAVKTVSHHEKDISPERKTEQNENLWGKDDRMQQWLKFSKEPHWAVTGAANESSGKIRRSPTQHARENAWTAARWNLSQRGMAWKDSRQIPVFSKKPWKPPPSSLPSCHPYSAWQHGSLPATPHQTQSISTYTSLQSCQSLKKQVINPLLRSCGEDEKYKDDSLRTFKNSLKCIKSKCLLKK